MSDIVEEKTAVNLSGFPAVRMRRLRQHPKLRDLVRETEVTVNDLVLPLFVKANLTEKQPISSMPGHFQLTLNDLDAEIAELDQLGIPAVILFGIPSCKDATGSDALSELGIMQCAIQKIKAVNSNILVMADLCFCEYTDHGHCGVVEKNLHGDAIIENDATLTLLAQQAVSLAQAGADVIAPSGMMDGMVAAIRAGLDQHGFSQVPILSYAVKYASSLYGPFREAAEGTPQFGDRRSYQMDPANGARGLREAQLDVAEGADMLMVKPASFYLDIIRNVKHAFPAVPLGAYQVSGEYSMIKAAAEKGWLDHDAAMHESLLAIKRAGADFIISYFAKTFAEKFSC